MYNMQKLAVFLHISFRNNRKKFDLSCKGETHIIAEFHRTDLVICSHSRERKKNVIAK